MIKVAQFEEFRYSEPDFDAIKVVVPDALRHQFDQVITRRSMEAVLSAYIPQDVINDQRQSREELETLRADAETLRTRIAAALALQLNIKNVGPLAIPHSGVGHDMLDATSNYFTKLSHALDHRIAKAAPRSRKDNARKAERDKLLTALLALWIDIGGKPRGKAAANFLFAASKPVYAETFDALEQWLKRRKKITKPVRRRRAA